VREVVIRLRQRGVDARVVTSDLYTEIPWARLSPDVIEESTTADGIPIHRHRAVSLPGDLHYPFLPGLALDLRKERPDVVHVHTYGTYQMFSALFAERLDGIPYVVTAHYHPTWSIWGGAGRKRLREFYDRHAAAHVLRHASRLILQTKEEERLMREVVPDLPQISFVPPGYSPIPAPQDGSHPFREKYDIKGRYLIFVGRLASNKGLNLLAKAFASLAADYPGLSLAVVGEDGGHRDELQREVRALGIADKVKLVGWVDDGRLLVSAYADAEALVLPSEYEAFGLVLLEAMAQGTPVVASRVGGIPGVVVDGKNGLLFESGNAPELAQKIRMILDETGNARLMGAYGRDVTVPLHTWERVVSSLESIYREVIGGKEAR
jgi:glycosyltransferase involved in cell wall biosynthesis